ncbi:MAG: transglycosylase family protein [Actinomycetota bacterium]|nr:transglycosylase family protein [Actinomycetota bacterium]
MTPRQRRQVGVLIGIALIVVSLPFLGGSSALGGTIDEKRAEAARLQSRIDAQAERIAALDRQSAASRQRADQADFAVAKARSELAQADQRMAEIGVRLSSVAVEAYVQGSPVSFLEQLDSTDGKDLLVRSQYFKTTASGQRDALDALKAARADLALKRSVLEQAQQSARSAASSVEAQLLAVAEAESSQRNILARVNGELGQLLREEQARRSAEAWGAAQAAAARRAAVRTHTASSGAAVVSPGHTAPGGMWTCIRQRESSGNYRSGGGGAYQFRQSTWESVGGTGRPEDADPETQDAKAMELQQRSGWSQWTTARACGAS